MASTILFKKFGVLFQSDNALLYDSVQLFAKAMDDLTAIEGISFDPLKCHQQPMHWRHGEKVLNYLKVSWQIPLSFTNRL